MFYTYVKTYKIYTILSMCILCKSYLNKAIEKKMMGKPDRNLC